jgi:uncharacterized protein (DUF2062 family)
MLKLVNVSEENYFEQENSRCNKKKKCEELSRVEIWEMALWPCVVCSVILYSVIFYPPGCPTW